MTYEELFKAGAFRSGGVVAFEANIIGDVVDIPGDILTVGIQAVEDGKPRQGEPTHVGIVPPLPKYIDSPEIVMAESTIIKNTITGKTISGPQVNLLPERLEGYDGRAWFLPFKSPLNWAHAEDIVGQKFGKDHYAVAHLFEDLGRKIGIPIPINTDHEEVCCEYVLEWLQAAGLPGCPTPAGSTPETVLRLPCLLQPVQMLGPQEVLR